MAYGQSKSYKIVILEGDEVGKTVLLFSVSQVTTH